MTSRFKARANALLSRHLPSTVSALSDALTPQWDALRVAPAFAHTKRFLAALPTDGWRFSLEDEAPTFHHPKIEQLPSDARTALDDLMPWRKGPWQFADVHIDAEWRSDFKWERIVSMLPPLEDEVIIDVGSNNGYYAQRLLAGGAKAVFGLDPQLLYVSQALCAEALTPERPVVTLPGGLEHLVHCPRSASLIFLMGILYHRTDPLETLRLCAHSLDRGGKLLIETIIIPGHDSSAIFVPKRYAGAKGFYWLPTEKCLHAWIRRANLRVLEQTAATPTTSAEQRSTDWRHGDSLPEGLDPNDPQKTIEGHPAPLRIALLCARG